MALKYIKYKDFLDWNVHLSATTVRKKKKLDEICSECKSREAFNMILNMELSGAIQMPRSAQELCGWDRHGKEGQEGLNGPLKSDESWQLAKYPKIPIGESKD